VEIHSQGSSFFKGFKSLINEDTSNPVEVNGLKDKLINSILMMSGNENNEMLKISLETLNEEELKRKLTTYV
jgi:hypothetical protein